MLCPVCNANKVQKDKVYGYLPCPDCRNRQKSVLRPSSPIEFTSSNIKEDRIKYFKSIIQKYRNGQLSKEFVEAYPERAKAMVKEGIHTEKEIKNAKNVWSDISPMGGIGRTK